MSETETPQDQALGPWVYCGQHLAAHRSGWCTVGLEYKVGLGEFKGPDHEQFIQANEKCHRLGFKLYKP